MSVDAAGRAAMADEDGGSGNWGKNSLNGSVNGKFSKSSNVFIFTYHHVLIFIYFNFYRTGNQILEATAWVWKLWQWVPAEYSDGS